MNILNKIFGKILTDYTIETETFDSFPKFWKNKMFQPITSDGIRDQHYLTNYNVEFISINNKFYNITSIVIDGRTFIRLDNPELLPQTIKILESNNSVIILYENTEALKNEIENIECERINKEIKREREELFNKAQFKRDTKNEIKKRFVIGKEYILRFRSNKNSKFIKKTYICKKFIYTMRDTVLNAIIVKQTSGPKDMIFTLSKEDCKRLHIKYEDGLQILSMKMDWIEKK